MAVSINQAVACLGCSRRTIYNYINAGKVRTIRTLGNAQLIVLEDLQKDPRFQPEKLLA